MEHWKSITPHLHHSWDGFTKLDDAKHNSRTAAHFQDLLLAVDAERKGLPGEVSAVQLEDAINGTSTNSNAVDTLGMVVTDPPTQSEVQQIADKVDELIAALRR